MRIASEVQPRVDYSLNQGQSYMKWSINIDLGIDTICNIIKDSNQEHSTEIENNFPFEGQCTCNQGLSVHSK